jgi:hypothetical protein
MLRIAPVDKRYDRVGKRLEVARMHDFKVGDHVHVIKRQGRSRQLGKIKRIVPNLSDDERFQAYVVAFDTSTGIVSEHYLQYELQAPGAE